MRSFVVCSAAFMLALVTACTSSTGGGGQGGTASGGSGGVATGGHGGTGGTGTGPACGSTTCKANEVCAYDLGGGGGPGSLLPTCAPDPCAPAALDCACADSLCAQLSSINHCSDTKDREVWCSCPGC